METGKDKASRIRANGVRLLRGLFDLQFATTITTEMLPVIYGMAIIFAALATLYSIGWAFGESIWLGLAWLLVIGPIMFISVVTTVRVVLEFILTVFRIACQLDTTVGQVEDISDGLPRIRFWRSRVTRNSEDDS